MWVSVVTNQFSFHDLANQYIPSWWKSDWYKPPNDVALNPDLWTHLSRAVGTVLFSQKNPPYFIPVQWTLYHEYLDSYCIFILAAIGSMIPPTQRIMFYVSTYLLTHIFEINYLPDFIFGLMIAELGEFGVFEKFTKSKTSISKIIPAVAFFMCPISFIFIDNFTNKEQLQAHFAVTFLIVAVEISPTLQYLLSRPFSVFLGHVSFGVYLLHPILMHSVCPMLVPFVVGKKYLKGANISWIVYLETLMMMMMVFSYFGWIFYKTVDLWSVKVGRVVESFFFDDKFDIKKPSLSLSENLESSRKWCLEMLLFWWDVLVWCWIRWMISVLLDMSLLGVKFFGWIKGLETSGQYVKVNSNED
ncbi:hypothetical protein HK098_002417 [Nowakowskiella sp. JEL0407]|nr:hypothetical protein HK098_002417 [Nowakowskiella sp. JEL0407]